MTDFFEVKNSKCFYEDPVTKSPAHPMYYKTGWTQKEYHVLAENNMIQKITDSTPLNRINDLFMSNYTLYYKPYSLWKKECQEKYY